MLLREDFPGKSGLFSPLQPHLPGQGKDAVDCCRDEENAHKVALHKEARRMRSFQQEVREKIGYGGKEQLTHDPAESLIPEDEPEQPKQSRQGRGNQQVVGQGQPRQNLYVAVERLSPQQLLLTAVAVNQPVRHRIRYTFGIVPDRFAVVGIGTPSLQEFCPGAVVIHERRRL